MKSLLLFFLLIPTVALAHPVDDPCRPDQILEDGCQPIIPELKLDDAQFYAARKHYWHERRNLINEIVEYAQCVGSRAVLQKRLGWPIDKGVEAILRYYDVIPSLAEFPAAVWRAEIQAAAAEDTRAIVGKLKWDCDAEVSYLEMLVAQQSVTYCCNKKKRNCKPC